MFQEVMDTYGSICNLVASGKGGEDASVAILDSVYKPSVEFLSKKTVGYTRDFVDRPDIDETTGHGRTVTSLMTGWADCVEYNFYRVVQESGRVPQRALLKAMGQAHLNDEVDIINLSLGYDHSNDGVSCDMPNEPCKVRYAAKEAVKDGITVIAAAGNANDAEEGDNDGGVCCPAILDEVISVGGMFVACGATPEVEAPSEEISLGKRTAPPLACWVKRDGELQGDPICTGLGCSMSPEHGCEDNRIIAEWGGNVEWEPGEIDILAPVEYPVVGPDIDPSITSGTSFGVPIITSVVSVMVSLVKGSDKEPVPSQIRKAIMKTGDPVKYGEGDYLQGSDAVSWVVREKNMEDDVSVRHPRSELD